MRVLYSKGDRVQLSNAKTTEVGTVVGFGATLNPDGSRRRTLEVLWPVGSEEGTRGFEGRLRRWHELDEIVFFERTS